MKITLKFTLIRRRGKIYHNYENDYDFFIENKRTIYDKYGKEGLTG